MKNLFYIIVTLLLSLPMRAQEVPDHLSPYEEALIAVKIGNYTDVKRWYNSLPNKEKRKAQNIYIATLSAINSYDIPLAEKRLKGYKGLKLKKSEELALRKSIENHLEKVKRLLSNTRTVSISDVISDTPDKLNSIIARQTSHLGISTPTTYTTPDSKTKWQVSIDTDSLPAFQIVHKLGNGKWDEANAETIIIRGLPTGASISYPFLMSDGNTLYFSIEQQGTVPENNLGGKDIYVSRYDRDAKALLIPTPLSLPFNSPADDYAYIVDEQSDFGWLISSRQPQGDTIHLYVFTPSTLTRYEGDDTAEIASLHNPKITPREQKRVGIEPKVTHQPVLFWMGSSPIRSARDLPTSQARSAFTQYLQLQQAMSEAENTLRVLRESVAGNPRLNSDTRTREQILSLEERLADYATKLKAIRNEVIRLSSPNNK